MKHCRVEGCHRTSPTSSLCSTHQMRATRAKKKYTLTCAHCMQDVRVGCPGQKYCSAECSRAAIQARPKRPRRRRATHARRSKPGTCISCGSNTGDNRCLRCKACEKSRRIAAKLPVLYVGPPHRRQPRPNRNPVKASTRRFKSGQCTICQTWFVSLNGDLTCSTGCATIRLSQYRRLAKDRRRAVKRKAYVADVWRKTIFERDGYRCHLCAKKTNPKHKVPHPKAPTIDHIVPLAGGGTHEPLNCRTACFRCNSLKGDRGGGEQLLLIA